MNKGISFYFGFNLKPEISAKLIKEAGFTSVITNADKKFKYQNGSIRKQIKIFKKYGIKLSSLHMQYNREELPYFWQEGKAGEHLKRRLIKDVKIAKKYGFTCVVVHLYGEYSKIGEKRLREVLALCEKLNVPLAIENIDCQKLFLEVFEKISSHMLKFCYDSGHNHVYDPDFNYLTKFSDKLIALHLHDNDGTADQHTLNKFGNINWKAIAKKLKGHEDISLDYEILYRAKNNLTEKDVLAIVKNQADELERLIEAAE